MRDHKADYPPQVAGQSFKASGVKVNQKWKQSWQAVLSARLVLGFITGFGLLLIVFLRWDLFLSPPASSSKLLPHYPSGLSSNASKVIVSQSSKHPGQVLACRRTMKYFMDNNNGFFSELHLVIHAIAIGKSYDYEVLIDDSAWNYGLLSDYFDLDPPGCKPPVDWKEMRRAEFCQQNGHIPDHVRLGRSCVPFMDQLITEWIPYKVKEVQIVWNFLNARDDLTVMPAGQNLHPLLKPLFESQSTELRKVWKLHAKVQTLVEQLSGNMTARISASAQRAGQTQSSPKPKVIVCHYRLGDKEHEQVDNWMGSHLVGLPPSFDRPARYVRVAQQMVRDFGWGSNPQKPLFVVMSDDMKHAISRLDAHAKSFDPVPVDVMPLATLHGDELQAGHNQFEFNEKSSAERIESARWLLSEVEWVRRHADGVVCSVTSNICVALMLLGGFETVMGSHPKIRSIDQRWAPTPHLRQLDGPQLPIHQLLARAQTLAAEKENQIHL